MLVVGDPLAGKTRLAYEVMRAGLPHRCVMPDGPGAEHAFRVRREVFRQVECFVVAVGGVQCRDAGREYFEGGAVLDPDHPTTSDNRFAVADVAARRA